MFIKIDQNSGLISQIAMKGVRCEMHWKDLLLVKMASFAVFDGLVYGLQEPFYISDLLYREIMGIL